MGIWSRLRNTVSGDRHDAEIDEELQFHLDMDAADGHERRQTRLRLGNVTRIHEETRAMGIVEWIDSTLYDARYGLRQLRRTPALTLAVVLSLAVGLGANCAIFSLVDAAILRPLPVSNPGALVIVEWTNDDFPSVVTNHNGETTTLAGGRRRSSSVGANLYRRLAREQTVFEPLMGIGAYPDAVAIASDSFPAEQRSLQYISGNFFQGLGAMPVLGRPFRDDEDRVGAEPVVIVSHRFWVSRLGRGDSIGRYVRINTVQARIVGVAPPGFFGIKAGQWPDIYAPLAIKVAFQAGDAPRVEDDGNWWVRQVGRLKPGISEAAARTQVNGLFRGMMIPDGTKTMPELVTRPGRRGLEALAPRDVSALWILMLLVGVLLLIVCANVANLLLSRAVARQRESAVRLALGATRARLFRQHLIESGILALLGGGAGLVCGGALAHAIHGLFQSGRDVSSTFDLDLDARAFVYTAVLSILTAVLFGLAPAVRASGADLGDTLKTQTRSVMGGRLRLPRLLVALQIALCLAALVAAGLLGRTLDNLKWIDVGFDAGTIAYASVSPSRAGYSAERVEPYVERVREQLARLPGVVHVSPVSFRALSGMGNNGLLNFQGRPLSQSNRANLNSVGDDFFETLQIPLRAGRTIEPRDMRPNADAAVVDEVFAQRFFPNENPLGRRFGFGPNDNHRYEIVGVVGGSRYNSLRGDPYPIVYEPYRPGGTIHFAIRTAIDPARLAEPVRQAIAAVDPSVPLTEFHTQAALIDRLLRTERLLGFVSGAFGVVALTLAAIGLGGLLAYATARRTSEIGLRMAMGAAAGDVVRMVLRDSLWMVGAGIVIGLPCAYAIARVLKTSLFGLEPFDLRTAAASIVVLFAVALLAAWVPARRAARIDPVLALREE